MMKNVFINTLLMGLTFLAFGVFASDLRPKLSTNQQLVNKLDQSMDITQTTNLEGKKSQQKINILQTKTDQVLHDIRQTTESLKLLNTNNEHLQKTLQQQAQQKESLQKQLDTIAITEKSIVPLMLDMIAALESRIETNLPFLMTERRARISALKAMMIQAELQLPEKYRRVLEAYEIEREFAYSVESYAKTIVVNSADKQVSILRIGQIALYYQSQDASIQGFWNSKLNQWQTLPEQYQDDIRKGILMANKSNTAELLRLPVTIKGTLESTLNSAGETL